MCIRYACIGAAILMAVRPYAAEAESKANAPARPALPRREPYKWPSDQIYATV